MIESIFSQIFKLRRRGIASKKANQDQPKELPGSYSKGDFAHESIHEPQGTDLMISYQTSFCQVETSIAIISPNS